MAFVAGCDKVPELEGGGEITQTRQQAVESQQAEESERVGQPPQLPELKPSPDPIGHLEPPPPEAYTPPTRPDLPQTIEEYLASPGWPADLAAKQASKPTSSPAVAADPPDFELIARQERFRQMVSDRQAEFDRLDPADRAQAYEDLKRKEIGE